MTPLVFTVPMPPHVTNRSRGSSHWRRGYNEKIAYWTTLDVLSCSRFSISPSYGYVVPSPPLTPFACVSAMSVMYLGGAMDDDNALARHKPLLDWLKKRRYLADDRKKNIVWTGLPEQVIRRDGNYRIVLTLTELSRGAVR
jgi:hypothetical protein